jgi:hypothetical protein
VSIGARQLAVSQGQCVGAGCPATTDPCAATATVIENTTQFLNPANMTLTFVFGTTTEYSGPASGASCSSSSTSTGAAGNLVQGAAAQVTATYPCSISIYGFNVASNCTLWAQTTELVQ